jgi:hypothetical protein
MTWVYDGKVFIKTKATDKPKVLKTRKDLPKK